MGDLRTLIDETEEHAVLPPGQDERFTGYGVMGVPFESGHVLALRRFPVTSIGPGYTSVWLRLPTGVWTMYADAAPKMSCSRYFGSALESSSVHDITVTWHDDRSFTVRIGDDIDLTYVSWDQHAGTQPLLTRPTCPTATRPSHPQRSAHAIQPCRGARRPARDWGAER